MLVEFVIARRPLSSGASGKNRWKELVQYTARQHWDHLPVGSSVRLTIVYLSGIHHADVDNIIKPIQDALKSVLYFDDDQVTDVDSHRRSLMQVHDVTGWPEMLVQALNAQAECLYVRVQPAAELGEYL